MLDLDDSIAMPSAEGSPIENPTPPVETEDGNVISPSKISPISSMVSEVEERVSTVSSFEIPRPMKTCLVLSISFALVHTAYLAIQDLQSSLNSEANLGLSSLSVLYGTIFLCGTQAPFIIRLLGPKHVLELAWLFHCFYTLANFYPSWATLMPSSILVGAIYGPMWTAQGIYITAAGETHAMLSFKRVEANASSYEKYVHVVLSRFNSIFFMCYGLTHVSGNFISSLVLSKGSFQFSANSHEASAVCGPNNCPSPSLTGNTTTAPIKRAEASTIFVMLSIFLGCNICGLLLTVFCLPKKPDKNPETIGAPTARSMSKSALSSTLDELIGCFRMLVDCRMVFLLPVFAAQSMAKGLLYADYTKAYISCVIGVGWVGFIMSSFGLCSAVSTIGISNVASALGRIILINLGILFHIGSIIGMLVWNPTGKESAALYFVIPALSGVAEGILLVQFNILIGQVFAQNVAPAFAAYHTSKAASFTITFGLSTFFCVRTSLYLSLVFYILGLMGYLFIELSLKKSAHDETRLERGISSFRANL